jgi:Na+-transporting methylmalonyl-CoA/oxaloacetate decarboxylase gamma subunit
MKAMKFNLFNIVLGTVLLVGSQSGLLAQSTLDLRINEFLVYNDSNYVDDFGMHQPWIEIYNSAYNTVNIGGLYLTNDLSNPTKYAIPKGQPITSIATQSYLVFWADNMTTRGILHLNFDLRHSKMISLFDANGKTLLDSVTIPVNQKPDITYGRIADGGPEWSFLLKSTPNATNQFEAKTPTSVTFKKMDPTGAGMTVIAMTVVFIGLALLYFFFKIMGKYMTRNTNKTTDGQFSVQTHKHTGDEISGEVNAAIAMALYLHLSQLHDSENTVLTINKVSRTYSPWSSKIYGLRKVPGQY